MVSRGSVLAAVAGMASLTLLAGGPPPAATDWVNALRRHAHIVTIMTGLRDDAISGADEIASCTPFKLSVAEIAKYLDSAREVSERRYEHDLDAHPCFTSGKFRLDNGEIGTFRIDMARRAIFQIGGKPARYFHCAHCLPKVFGATIERRAP